MSIEDYLEQNEPEYVERMLNPGQVVYETCKGEVKEHYKRICGRKFNKKGITLILVKLGCC